MRHRPCCRRTSRASPTARRNRCAPAHGLYHVVNRGNDRRRIFCHPAEYDQFRQLLRAGTKKFPLKIIGFCQMPNHVHLLVEPGTDAALSDFMQWTTGNYACWWRKQTLTLGYGHVFQRRFWSAPITGAEHFLDVLRYIEANPKRAGLVARAEEWEWSSLPERRFATSATISPPPLVLPDDWAACVNAGQAADTVTSIRREITPTAGRPRSRK